MTPPILLILSFGSDGIPIPLPLFLLWPFIGLAWLTLTLVQLFIWSQRGRGMIAFAKHALAIFCRLSGMRVDVESKNGSDVHIQII